MLAYSGGRLHLAYVQNKESTDAAINAHMSLRIWTESASDIEIRERLGHKEAPVGTSGQLEEGLLCCMLQGRLPVRHREYFPGAVLIVTASLMSDI